MVNTGFRYDTDEITVPKMTKKEFVEKCYNFMINADTTIPLTFKPFGNNFLILKVEEGIGHYCKRKGELSENAVVKATLNHIISALDERVHCGVKLYLDPMISTKTELGKLWDIVCNSFNDGRVWWVNCNNELKSCLRSEW